MKIAVVYASRTGNTRRAAELIGAAVEDRDHDVSVAAVDDLDFKALAEADLVILGSWVDGLFFIGQRPGDVRRRRKVPKLTGKQVAVFLTYAVDPGGALGKFQEALENDGATVLGGYAWKRNTLPAGVEDFVDGILAAAAPAAA